MVVSPNLVRLSRIMALLSLIGALMLPLATAVCFLFPFEAWAVGMNMGQLAPYLSDAVPLENRILGGLVALVPDAIMMWGLWSLNRLFGLYAEGEVFSPDALRALRNVATAMFWRVLAGFAMQPAIVYLLTMWKGPGERAVALGIGSGDVFLLFLGGVALVIARVMTDARGLAEENASFV